VGLRRLGVCALERCRGGEGKKSLLRNSRRRVRAAAANTHARLTGSRRRILRLLAVRTSRGAEELRNERRNERASEGARASSAKCKVRSTAGDKLRPNAD